MKKRIIILSCFIIFILTILVSCRDTLYSVDIDTTITNGTILSSHSLAKEGEIITIITTPDEGYTLSNLYYKVNNENTAITNNSFTMPANDIVITASFTKSIVETLEYTITGVSLPGGTITPSKELAKVGEIINLTVSLTPGYILKELYFTLDNDKFSIIDNRFTMPAGNVIIKAVFEENTKNNKYYNPYGFASINITDYSIFTNNLVTNELEFLDAILAKKNVIQIKDNIELDLGYLNVIKLLVMAGRPEDYYNSFLTNFTTNAKGIDGNDRMHPDLIVSGVGKLTLKDINKMIIYSQAGATIKHLGIIINNCTNITFRNLKMTDLWEWDEGTKGKYDGSDWQYFGVKYSSDLWFDHMTFGIAYDGIIDIEDKSTRITISYIEVEGHITDFIRRQFAYLDENIDKLPYYKYVKEGFSLPGLSYDDMLLIYSSQKKGFNIGTADDLTDKDFDKMTVTIHNSYFKNFQDRLPRLRAGDVHMYNVITDQSEIQEIVDRIGNDRIGQTSSEGWQRFYIVRQAIVSTQGGAVLAENMLFIDVKNPIKTNQAGIKTDDARWSGEFLVINSEYRFQGTNNKLDSTQANTAFKSSSSVYEYREFSMTNYKELPYNYQVVDTDILAEYLEGKIGSGSISNINWLEINKEAGINTEAVNHKIDEQLLKDIFETTVYFAVGDTIVYQNPQVYNYYKTVNNTVFTKDKDYTLTITGNIDNTTAGTYLITYTFTSLIDDEDTIVLECEVVILPDDFRFMDEPILTNEYNQMVDCQFITSNINGRIYYLSSNQDQLTHLDVITNNEFHDYLSNQGTIKNITTNHQKYLYLCLVNTNNQEMFDFIKLEVTTETVISINTPADFTNMLNTTSANTIGKYYSIESDIDLKGITIKSSEDFRGVLDGNNHTIKNITHNQALFKITFDAVIKNINIDTAEVTGNVQNTAAVLIGRTQGLTKVYNVTLTNSNVGPSNMQYASLLIANLDNNKTTPNSLFLQNIAIINCNLTTSGNNTGALLAMGYTGWENPGILEISDIFISNVTITSTGTGSGLVVGRIRTTNAKISRVVVENSSIAANDKVGAFSGLIGNECQTLYLTDIFIDASVSINNTESSKIGYITGSNDNTNQFEAFINRVYVINKFDISQSGQQSINPDSNSILSDNQTTESWWITNLNGFDENILWTYNENSKTMQLIIANIEN